MIEKPKKKKQGPLVCVDYSSANAEPRFPLYLLTRRDQFTSLFHSPFHCSFIFITEAFASSCFSIFLETFVRQELMDLNLLLDLRFGFPDQQASRASNHSNQQPSQASKPSNRRSDQLKRPPVVEKKIEPIIEQTEAQESSPGVSTATKDTQSELDEERLPPSAASERSSELHKPAEAKINQELFCQIGERKSFNTDLLSQSSGLWRFTKGPLEMDLLAYIAAKKAAGGGSM